MKKLILILLVLFSFSGYSQNEWVISKVFENITAYKNSFIPDGGVLGSDRLTKAYMLMAEENEMFSSIEVGYMGEAAFNIREDGIYDYAATAYDFGDSFNDITQTTESSQPYISGGIAPTGRLGMLNPNGDTRYMTHPEISFGATDAWSVTTVINNNWINETSTAGRQNYAYLTPVKTYGLMLGKAGEVTLYDNNGPEYSIGSVNYANVGKNTVFTYIYTTTECVLYVNGVLVGSIAATDVEVSFAGLYGDRFTHATISAHIIRSIALDSTQVSNEAIFLQSLYPPIPSVTIGEGDDEQTWGVINYDAVTTAKGTVIANVEEAANVEKTTNGDVEAGLTGWTSSRGTMSLETTIVHGGANSVKVLHDNVETTTFIRNTGGSITSGSWVMGSILVYNDGETEVSALPCVNGIVHGSGSTSTSTGSWVKLEILFQSTETGIFELRLFSTGASASGNAVYWDDAAIEEVGWSGSQDLYTALIAQGESVYDATAASAFWAYYSNDSEIGSWSGKLYNWFSTSLIQLDIDLYNVANPTAHWGWHIPSQAEFTTLQTTLGGSTVAGGKMKVEGEDYWDSPNVGATNSSGFSGLGSGFRNNSTGVFSNINTAMRFWGITESTTFGVSLRNDVNSDVITIDLLASKGLGYQIRLIKD